MLEGQAHYTNSLARLREVVKCIVDVVVVLDSNEVDPKSQSYFDLQGFLMRRGLVGDSIVDNIDTKCTMKGCSVIALKQLNKTRSKAMKWVMGALCEFMTTVWSLMSLSDICSAKCKMKSGSFSVSPCSSVRYW